MGMQLRFLTETIVHLARKEREYGTEDGSKYGVCGQDRGSIDGIRVDKVVHNSYARVSKTK